MSKFWIELSKVWDNVVIAHEHTTNPQVFPHTWKKVVGINWKLGSAEEVMNMFMSITKRAKTIGLIIEWEIKEVLVTPQSTVLRIKDHLNGAPNIQDWRYQIQIMPQNQNMTYWLEVTPDGKSYMQWKGHPTTQALKNAYPY